MFDRIALIGIGLIGSSLARLVRREGLARHIAVATRRQTTLDQAVALGLADSGSLNPCDAVSGADLVVIATPLSAYADVTRSISGTLASGTIVTDVGSVKQAAIEAIAPHLPAGIHFVPGHPVAGTEKSGPDAGFAELFEGRWCILTPEPSTDPKAVKRVAGLWRRAGMRVEMMDARHHDHVLAITSHLPHLIAYTIVGTATDLESDLQKEVMKFSAGGFRDFTRIAASDPVMWRDIFLTNRDAILDILGRFNEDLTALQRAIRRGKGDVLEAHFARARAIRRGVVDMKQA